jgi:tetratricopeptide (TPR) repeat protein
MESHEQSKDAGDACLAVGELEEAVAQYRRAVEIRPDYWDGWHALTMALVKLNRLEEAIQAGLQATRLDPDNLFGWTSLSLAYVRNHQIAEAEAASAKAKVLSWGGKIKID